MQRYRLHLSHSLSIGVEGIVRRIVYSNEFVDQCVALEKLAGQAPGFGGGDCGAPHHRRFLREYLLSRQYE